MVKLLMQGETENQDGGRFKKQVCPQKFWKTHLIAQPTLSKTF